ncbi:hypothetical protein ABPG74_019486 [Tetrahymena malaccensis]
MSSDNSEQEKQMQEEITKEQKVLENEENGDQNDLNGEGSRNQEEAEEITKILKESSSKVNEKYLESRLTEAVDCYKNKNFDQAENIFSDLMIYAVKFYKSETHVKMSKYFFFYGDMLLSKLENNPDVFGDKAQKKLDNQTTEEVEKNPNQMASEEVSEQKMIAQKEQKEEDEEENEESQSQGEEEIVQLDTVIFKDENVEIRDETNEPQNNEENKAEGSNLPIGKVTLEKSDPIDDLQLAWENLELSRKIYNQELSQLQDSSDEDRKEKQIEVRKQIVEVTLRIADLEQWRDNFSDALKEYTLALQLAKEIEDREYSRTLSSIFFQLGNAVLYENKEYCEEEGLKNFIDSAQILENCLSKKIAIPPQELPSFKILKKDDIKVDHLKHSFLDDDESKEIKDTLKVLYEKIEDTLIQRDERDKYKAYQELMKKQSQNQNQFAQPSQNSVPIKNLGTFGSLKRKEPSSENSNSQNGSSTTMNIPPQESGNSQQSSNTSQISPDGNPDKMLKKD